MSNRLAKVGDNASPYWGGMNCWAEILTRCRWFNRVQRPILVLFTKCIERKHLHAQPIFHPNEKFALSINSELIDLRVHWATEHLLEYLGTI